MTRNNTRPSSQGDWIVKRRFTLPAMAQESDAQAIAERFGRLSGVRGTSADIERHRLTVVYDFTQSDCMAVLAALEETGFPVADNRWARFKTNLFQYLDTNGRDNANAPAAPCCSNPKGICQPRR